MFELLTDPRAWIAFLTLTGLELVLGIDNIVFMSILVDKLPSARMFVVGVVLIADGLDHHVPKGYVYFAMLFSLSVELLNIYLRRRSAQPVELHERYARA